MRAFPTPNPDPAALSLDDARHDPRHDDPIEAGAQGASARARTQAGARPDLPTGALFGTPAATLSGTLGGTLAGTLGGTSGAGAIAVDLIAHHGNPGTGSVDAARVSRFRRMLRIMIWTWICAHVLFLVVFAALGVHALTLLNAASVTAYVGALLLLRRGRIGPAFGIGVTEIIVHAVVATLIVGWSAGFHYYVPFIAAMVFLYPRGSVRAMAPAAGAVGLVYAALAVYSNAVTAPVALPVGVLHAMNVTNGFYFTAALAFLSFVSTSVARRAEDGLRDAVATLDDMARKDTLTGLMNRRSMEQELRREAARHSRTGSPFAIAIADLDAFKGINDRFGHHAGDRVLAAAAVRMREALRLHDQVARWGGEEFLVLLPDTESHEARAVAERLRHGIGDVPVKIDGKFVSVTVTIGVAVFTGGDWSDTLRAADRALYRGKAGGRNQVVPAPEG